MLISTYTDLLWLYGLMVIMVIMVYCLFYRYFNQNDNSIIRKKSSKINYLYIKYK